MDTLNADQLVDLELRIACGETTVDDVIRLRSVLDRIRHNPDCYQRYPVVVS